MSSAKKIVRMQRNLRILVSYWGTDTTVDLSEQGRGRKSRLCCQIDRNLYGIFLVDAAGRRK